MGPAYRVPPSPRSPDLTACDFLLWGFVNGKVFITPPASIGDMRDRIVNELANLREDPEMIIKRCSGICRGALNSALKGVEDMWKEICSQFLTLQ